MANVVAAVVIIVVLIVAAAGGYLAASSGKVTSTVTSTVGSTVTMTNSGAGSVSTVTSTVTMAGATGNSSSGNITQDFAPSAQLLAAAKSEGTLSVYAPIPQSIFSQFYWSTFTQLYPWAKLNYFSSDPASIYSKTLSEYQANKVGSDVIISNFNYFILSKQNNVTAPNLLPVVPKYYPADAYDPQGYWYAYASIPVVVLYNTNLVTAAQAPKTYFDLTNSTWKGKIGFDLPSNLNPLGGTLATLSSVLGPTEWTSYVKGLAANQPKYYPDSGGVFQAVASGDVSVGLAYLQDLLQNKNASVKAEFLQPTIWQPAT
ncbi:MAG: ABC transporter substrate-binding protein, partial [Nitrososphaerales archaeon]